MSRSLLSLLFMVSISGTGFGAPSATDRVFEYLGANVGDFHQASILMANSPKEEPKDLEQHEPKNTLSVRKLGDSKFSLLTYSEGVENSASATVIERSGEKLTLTSVDLVDLSNSYRVTPTASGNSEAVQLNFYLSDVQYLEKTPEADAARVKAAEKRKTLLSVLLIGLRLLGGTAPLELADGKDSIAGYILTKEIPPVETEILLDIRGKSQLHPKGEPSLTLMKGYHKAAH